MEQTNPDLLNEFETQVNLEPVSAGVRFVHYFVDLFVLMLLVYAAVIAYVFSNTSSNGYYDPPEIDTLTQWMATIVIGTAYYTLMEGATGGRTLGKLITGAIAVKEDGSRIGFKEALLRSLVRFVPFEPLSAFGRPWHDSWTRTLVVKKFR